MTTIMERSPASRARVLLQLALLSLAIAILLWTKQRLLGVPTRLLSLLLLLFIYWSHRSEGVSLREVGFRLDTAARAAAPMSIVTSVAVIATLAIGASIGSWHFPSMDEGLSSWRELVLFGIAQQYVLLGFYYRGIERIAHSPTLAVVSTAILFAAFHLPNVFLMAVTFFAALVAVFIYRRSPNLWINGIAHGSISFTLYYALPIGLTHGLRVGSGYYE